MRRRNEILLLIILTAGLSAFADFHVAVTGDDANPGSEVAPFATLTRARNAVRALKAEDSLPEAE